MKRVHPPEQRQQLMRPADAGRPALVTGGAGFIGTNVAHRLLQGGRRVVLFDNLSRPGVEANVEWLRSVHGQGAQLILADVRDAEALREAAADASQVYHFAAQVAVTTSLDDPVHDFDVNAGGTLNLLEALRQSPRRTPLLFTSTNKVYGGLDDVELVRRETRYEPVDPRARDLGVGERPLDFHSPYGCSKGAADQYVLDYTRTFDLPAVVFRMSCIYGPHQHGNEDQGWVAHFLIRALRGETITLFGDGRQVRDVLFVDDLVDAMQLAMRRIDHVTGRAFNIGGGPEHTTSLLELLSLIGQVTDQRPRFEFDDWRPGDQRYYVSDISRFSDATGWRPGTRLRQGLVELAQWLSVSSANVLGKPDPEGLTQ